MKRYKVQIAANTLILLIIAALQICGPLILRHVTGLISENSDYMYAVGWFFASFTVLYLCKFFYNRFKFWFCERFKLNETHNIYQMISQIRYRKLNELEPTYLVEKTNSSVSSIFNLFSIAISGNIISWLTILVVLILAFTVDRVVFIVFLVQIPIVYYGFQHWINGKNSKMTKMSEKLQTMRAKENKDIKSVVGNADMLVQSRINKPVLAYTARSLHKMFSYECKVNTFAMSVCTILEYLYYITVNGLNVYIVILFAGGKIGISDMVFLNLLNGLFYSSMCSLTDIQGKLLELRSSLSFVEHEIIDNFEHDGTDELVEVKTISAEKLTFGYDDEPLVESGDFSVRTGDIVGVSSESGKGKSTLMKIIVGMIPSECVKINGVPVPRYKRDALMSKILYLPQQLYILPFSIRENIALGAEIPAERWELLTKMAFMQKFAELPDGLDTMVQENGANLSGGDRQKIILARIFVNEPDVIILDESVSSIDNTGGYEIYNDIVSQFSSKIIFIVSHNKEAFTICNTLLSIDGKRLAQTFCQKHSNGD